MKPIVYDIVIRQEVEARDEAEALSTLLSDLRYGDRSCASFEPVRDDNRYGPKDLESRNNGGHLVLNAEGKHTLLTLILDYAAAYKAGNEATTVELYSEITSTLNYLKNRARFDDDVRKKQSSD
ncbi:hypothetical protein [Laribacter hongkongensis]|uniref:hypothetical protein n=1 Tax=Laribacter hongkongensis TaxID=168471 RepID=UPI0004892D8B|nr:hypothetical protein [Laribacter hongkongensis]